MNAKYSGKQIGTTGFYFINDAATFYNGLKFRKGPSDDGRSRNASRRYNIVVTSVDGTVLSNLAYVADGTQVSIAMPMQAYLQINYPASSLHDTDDNPFGDFYATGVQFEVSPYTIERPGVSTDILTATGKVRTGPLSVRGSIFTDGIVTLTSDIRRKTNIVPLENCMRSVCGMTCYTYNRIEADQEPEKLQVGLIAQEVMAQVPELVHWDKDQDMYSVNYGGVTAVLVNAMKEMNTRLKLLENAASGPWRWCERCQGAETTSSDVASASL